MSATEVISFQDTLPPQRKPKDAETLARELVRANKLTKYQAQTLYQGKIKGLVFGEYRVLDKLGQGGMGVVLKAEHQRMKRVVAVKMIAGAALKSPDAVKRFYREVEAAARLEHPNIVTAYDASEHEGVHYLVMQFVDGKDLAAIVKERGPLPVAQAVECIIQAARGLQYAHEQGIVHRGMEKPSRRCSPSTCPRGISECWTSVLRARRRSGAGLRRNRIRLSSSTRTPQGSHCGEQRGRLLLYFRGPPGCDGLKTEFPAVGAGSTDTRIAVSGALPE